MGHWKIKLSKQLATKKVFNICFSYSHNFTLANGVVSHSVYKVWLSSHPAEFFTFTVTIVYDCKTGGFVHNKNKSCSNMTKYRLNTVIQHYHHEANFNKNYYFKQT